MISNGVSLEWTRCSRPPMPVRYPSLLHAGTRTGACKNERWDWSKDAWRKSDWGGDGDELRRMVVLSLDNRATRPKRLHLMLVDSGARPGTPCGGSADENCEGGVGFGDRRASWIVRRGEADQIACWRSSEFAVPFGLRFGATIGNRRLVVAGGRFEDLARRGGYPCHRGCPRDFDRERREWLREPPVQVMFARSCPV